jgi:CRP-like cAMP-binding protein
MYPDLRIALQMFSDCDERELDCIEQHFTPKQVKKNQILVREGSICKTFYYVRKGCLRTYFTDKNGRDKTRYIMADHHLGTALSSFITQRPSLEFLEAIEHSELLTISHDSFYELNNKLNGWKQFYQKILEMAYTFQNRKIEALTTLTAQQRYNQLMLEHPALSHRVTNKVLASYLDIREETLSRLKSGVKYND